MCRILEMSWPHSLLMLPLLNCVREKLTLSCLKVARRLKELVLIFPLEAWGTHTSSLSSVKG